jgi:hypothetical protein
VYQYFKWQRKQKKLQVEREKRAIIAAAEEKERKKQFEIEKVIVLNEYQSE